MENPQPGRNREITADTAVSRILSAHGELRDADVVTDWVVMAKVEDPSTGDDRVVVVSGEHTRPLTMVALARVIERAALAKIESFPGAV